MKFDKDTIVKQHFWLLAGTAAVLALAGWGIMLLMVPATASGDRDKIQKSWNNLKKYKDFKHPDFIKEKRDEAEKIKSDLTKIHGELYKSQEASGALMRWPKTMVDRGYDLRDGKFAYEVEVLAPKANAKSLPPDKETLISGTLGQSDQDWFEIVDGKGQTVKFLRTMNPKITDKNVNKSTSTNFLPLAQFKGRLVSVTYLTGKFFGDELTENEIQTYRDFYREQLYEILAELAPINAVDQPVMQFRYAKEAPRPGIPPVVLDPKEKYEVVNENWIYKEKTLPPPDNRFLPYVDNWRDKVKDITSEEVWAAQESMWVQRELFRQIKAANDAVAVCELNKATADKEGMAGTYRNFYWQIDLKVAEEGVSAKLTNLLPRPQSIDTLRFRLRFKDKDGKPSEAVTFPPMEGPGSRAFKALPVGPAGSANSTFATDKAVPLPGVALSGLHSVEQVLTVETAAVKRVDVVAVAAAFNGDTAVGHRHANKPLLPFDKSKKPPAAAPAPGPAAGADGKDDPAPPPPLVDMTTRVSKFHRIVLDRYIEVTAESRKLPVNLVLVVGPEHLNRVEAALVSSPLRFLPTQVLWQRCELTLGGSEGSRPSAGSGETQENIELTVYGMVTLYQRPNRPTFALPGKTK